MSHDQGFSNRVMGGIHEQYRHLSPLRGFFKKFCLRNPPLFDRCIDVIVSGIEQGKIPLIDDQPGRREFISEQIRHSARIAKKAAADMKDFKYKDTLLSYDQIASIHL